MGNIRLNILLINANSHKLNRLRYGTNSFKHDATRHKGP